MFIVNKYSVNETLILSLNTCIRLSAKMQPLNNKLQVAEKWDEGLCLQVLHVKCYTGYDEWVKLRLHALSPLTAIQCECRLSTVTVEADHPSFISFTGHHKFIK